MKASGKLEHALVFRHKDHKTELAVFELQSYLPFIQRPTQRAATTESLFVRQERITVLDE